MFGSCGFGTVSAHCLSLPLIIKGFTPPDAIIAHPYSKWCRTIDGRWFYQRWSYYSCYSVRARFLKHLEQHIGLIRQLNMHIATSKLVSGCDFPHIYQNAAKCILRSGSCGFNGEGCTLVEATLQNPTTPGSGSSADISLIPSYVSLSPRVTWNHCRLNANRLATLSRLPLASGEYCFSGLWIKRSFQLAKFWSKDTSMDVMVQVQTVCPCPSLILDSYLTFSWSRYKPWLPNGFPPARRYLCSSSLSS